MKTKRNYKTMRRNSRNIYKSKRNTNYNNISLYITTVIIVTIIAALGLFIDNRMEASEINTVNKYSSFDSYIHKDCVPVILVEELIKKYEIEKLEFQSTDKGNNDFENIETETFEEKLENNLGESVIMIDSHKLFRHDLPDIYYTNIDYSSFQPYMGYKMITNKSAPAYEIVNSNNSYTDELGFRRYKTNDSQFTINGADDYIIALGTFYKDKGLVGNRYLIVTSTGMYTAITGDEKSDAHTDSYNMFTLHDNGTKAGIIEWIVDTEKLEPDIKQAGTITAGSYEVLQGEILHIYEIQ